MTSCTLICYLICYRSFFGFLVWSTPYACQLVGSSVIFGQLQRGWCRGPNPLPAAGRGGHWSGSRPWAESPLRSLPPFTAPVLVPFPFQPQSLHIFYPGSHGTGRYRTSLPVATVAPSCRTVRPTSPPCIECGVASAFVVHCVWKSADVVRVPVFLFSPPVHIIIITASFGKLEAVRRKSYPALELIDSNFFYIRSPIRSVAAAQGDCGRTWELEPLAIKKRRSYPLSATIRSYPSCAIVPQSFVQLFASHDPRTLFLLSTHFYPGTSETSPDISFTGKRRAVQCCQSFDHNRSQSAIIIYFVAAAFFRSEPYQMDQKRFPMPPPGPAIRPQDGSSLSPVQKFRERAEESSISEYSTPRGSPTGRKSPGRPIKSAQPFSLQGPHPSRPPRPNEVMPIQAAKARNYVPMSSPRKSSEDLALYWDRTSKLSPQATHGQNSDDGTSSDDPISSTSTPPISGSPTSQSTTPPSGALRKPHLVPPSAARRGASSLYSQGTSFSPIMEESPDSGSRARASIASSRLVPDSWGSHPDDYNFDRIHEKIEEEEEIRYSPASPGSTASMHDDTTGLVRQASKGKMMKPSLTKIRSSPDNVSNRKETIGLATITAGVAAGALGPSPERTPPPAAGESPVEEVIGNRTIIIDSSSSNSRTSSPESGKGSFTLVEPVGRSRSPLASAVDRSARQPSPLAGTSRPVSKGPSMSGNTPSSRRPPHLDVGAVRDSETRASVTSLPDLIRRATRLAANLDRGKTASRTGMLDMINAEKKDRRRRSGSISDILAAFPPPSRDTPDGTRANSRWPSPFPSKLNQRMSYLTSHESGSTQIPRSGRRCCGMSLCAFVVVIFLLAILIAAAIVVPIVLIVLPRQRQAAANATGPSSLGHCPDSHPCQNGGVSVVSGDTCRCICANGFTGDHCATVADPGCTTTDIGTGAAHIGNATLGNAIPGLLVGSSTKYSIPLNSSAILSLFSTSNLSCTSENALVTFNGQSMKTRDIAPKLAGEDPLPSAHSASMLQPTPTPQADLPLRLQQRQIGTSNGIVFQITSSAMATPTSTSRSSSQTSTPASLSSTSSSASSSPPSSRTPSSETVDFARIVVLFVLEQTGQLNAAVKAQTDIQNYLFARANQGDSMSLGTDGTDLNLDFANFSIALGNGIKLGGKGDGHGGINNSKTKRSRNSWEDVA